MTESNDGYCDLHDIRHEEGCECSYMKEEKRVTTLTQDQQLQIEIKEGRITANEVADIWRQTEDLSPQTNINARREIIALRNLAKGRGPIEALAAQFPVFCNMMLRATNETQAALMRDETKFAHLVAGAEMVAKSMQEIGSLVDVLRDARSILGDMDNLSEQVEDIKDMLEEMRLSKKRWWQFWRYIPNWRDHEPETDELYVTPSPDTQHTTIVADLAQEGIPVDDPADEARKRTIGSAWDTKNAERCIHGIATGQACRQCFLAQHPA